MLHISIILSKKSMIKCKISGSVLNVEKDVYKSKKGEEIKQKKVVVYQSGSQQVFEVALPDSYEIEKGDSLEDMPVIIRQWASNGRVGFFVVFDSKAE